MKTETDSDFITKFAILSFSLLAIGFISQRIFTNSINKVLFSDEIPLLSDIALFGLFIMAVIIGLIIFIMILRTTAFYLRVKIEAPKPKTKKE